MTVPLHIRDVVDADAGPICALYNHYVLNTTVTFEEAALEEVELRARISQVQAASLPWRVAELEGQLVGYAYANPWRIRTAYRFTVESTIYLSPQHVGRGFGVQLYRDLLLCLSRRGVHSVIGGVVLPNPASTALHTRLGFRQAAHFIEVGFKFQRWLDVSYWQLTLQQSPDSLG